jgi:bacteriocin-like protein
MTDKSNADTSKKPDDKKIPPADKEISNEELDNVSGGMRIGGGGLKEVGGYGTLDYTTMTSHGGD